MDSLDSILSFKLSVIDHYASFQYLLGYRSSDFIDLNPNSYTPGSTVFCPFHTNTDSKAAKLYERDKETGVEKLYCFAENRLYFPHSLLSPPKNIQDKLTLSKFKSIVPYDPDWVFSAIWNHLPENDIIYWKTVNPEIQVGGHYTQYKPLYEEYKTGKIDLFTLLDKINMA